jgi:hypothetical protein
LLVLKFTCFTGTNVQILTHKAAGEEVEGAEFGMMAKIVMEERMLTYTTEPPPPKVIALRARVVRSLIRETL